MWCSSFCIDFSILCTAALHTRPRPSFSSWPAIPRSVLPWQAPTPEAAVERPGSVSAFFLDGPCAYLCAHLMQPCIRWAPRGGRVRHHTAFASYRRRFASFPAHINPHVLAPLSTALPSLMTLMTQMTVLPGTHASVLCVARALGRVYRRAERP